MSTVTAVPIAPTRKRILTVLWIGIALAMVIGIGLAFRGTSAVVATRGTNEQFLAWNRHQAGVEETASGLQYKVMKPGTGPALPAGQVPIVMYVGRLRDGVVFDQSQSPVPMPPQAMIKGFGEGLRLMSKGSQFRFWMKPELAYGAQSPSPTIPAGSLLVFDVAATDFVSEQALMQQMMQQQMQGGAQPR
jgi:hypothetical protein